MIILQRDEIEKLFNPQAARVALRKALEALSIGGAVVPEPACLRIRNTPAECHVKTGYLVGDDVYAVKVSNGFYDNPRRGLPSSDGMVLLFSSDTGAPLAVLIDRGFLTDMRTALTGALATQLLARPQAKRVGVVGCGTQARVQLLALRQDRPNIQARVWGRRPEQVQEFVARLDREGVKVQPMDLEEMVRSSEILITATAAHAPLVADAWVQPGTHITAVGADAEGKQELDIGILSRAHWVVADSKEHSLACGEAGVAVRAGVIQEANVLEMGALFPRTELSRPDDAITVADLTGVAVQDVAMARSVWEQCNAVRLAS